MKESCYEARETQQREISTQAGRRRPIFSAQAKFSHYSRYARRALAAALPARPLWPAKPRFGRRRNIAKIFAAFLLAGSFIAAFMPQPATAFELFGIHLWGKKKNKAEDEISEPKTYAITIAAAPETAPETGGDSAKTAQGASLLWAGRKRAVSGSGGLLAKARGDYGRILAAFYAAGRYGPVISISINGREAADIPYGAEFPADNKIVIKALGGPVYHFSAAEIGRRSLAGGAPPALDAALAEKLLAAGRGKTGYALGAAAQSGAVFAAEDMAINIWRQQGYAKAKIAERRIIADHAAKSVNARIDVDPGRQARFGALSIRNVSAAPRMNTPYIAWLTGLQEGEIYSPAALAKANARLNKLEVFRSAGLSEAENLQPGGALPLSLVLQERPLHRIGGGGQYSTIDGLGLSGYWLHRNLFGHAERLRLDAAVTNIAGNRNKSSANPKDYGYMLGGAFVRPGIVTPDTDYVASLKAMREVLDNYSSKGIYFSNGFNRQFNERLSGTLYANAAQVRVKDDIWGKRDFTTIGLSGGLLYDSRDNKSDSTKGLYGQISAEPFYETQYGNFVGKMTAEGRSYFSFDKKGRLVLALRGKFGVIGDAPIAELPSTMLFFIGGGGSVRGYAYRSVGLYKKGDKIIGGRSMVEGSAELRAMVSANIGVAGFVDAGVVGKNPMPDFDQNTKLGAGLGLRYKTGMGPMRVDVALPLNREKGDARYGLYIGIGQAF